MKKRFGRILTVACVASMALAMTACGGKEEGTSAAVSTEAATGSTGSATEGKTEGATEGATEAPASSANWVFKKGDVTIELYAPADPVIQALGNPQETYEAPSCAFDGMDVIYKYPGYEVLTYAKDGSAVISGVVLRDDTVGTPEGAYIGMTKADVEKIYGKTAESAGSLQVEKGNCNLLFIFDNDVVTSIQYNLVQQ